MLEQAYRRAVEGQAKPKTERDLKLDKVEQQVRQYVAEELTPLYQQSLLNPGWVARNFSDADIKEYATLMKLLAQDLDDLPHRMRAGFAGEQALLSAIDDDVRDLTKLLSRYTSSAIPTLERLRVRADPDEVAAAVDAMMTPKEN